MDNSIPYRNQFTLPLKGNVNLGRPFRYPILVSRSSYSYEVIWLLGSYHVFQAAAAGPLFGYLPPTITS